MRNLHLCQVRSRYLLIDVNVCFVLRKCQALLIHNLYFRHHGALHLDVSSPHFHRKWHNSWENHLVENSEDQAHCPRCGLGLLRAELAQQPFKGISLTEELQQGHVCTRQSRIGLMRKRTAVGGSWPAQVVVRELVRADGMGSAESSSTPKKQTESVLALRPRHTAYAVYSWMLAANSLMVPL